MSLLLALALVLAGTSVAQGQPRQPSDEWLADLMTEARARGYSDELLDQTLAGLVRAGKRRFLVHANDEALLHYNCAHHYALAVGILAERIGGGGE
jgi:membrane-bound lytic murein transglycosylase B